MASRHIEYLPWTAVARRQKSLAAVDHGERSALCGHINSADGGPTHSERTHPRIHANFPLCRLCERLLLLAPGPGIIGSRVFVGGHSGPRNAEIPCRGVRACPQGLHAQFANSNPNRRRKARHAAIVNL